ncbi:APG9-domain-containing protein [Lophiostoma macrostomum CBS 122681]|uniref:Autophagy-related protein 9 n=1 Tax=Lophiostoma macrostomum CBS 122681 TaxID=1314788 RepID=A0A6A6TBM5_9PLEO|nr:APG9-domain-containing protein [Lophiostoma macrostomum CBS 122681]
MASNIFSRLLPSASDEPSEDTELPTQRRRPSVADAQHEMDIDEENFDARFEAQDLEHLLADASSSHMTTESTAFLPPTSAQPSTAATTRPASWRQPAQPRAAPLYDDDDVPESLLLEGAHEALPPNQNRHAAPIDGLPPPVPGPSTRQSRAQWETTRRHQRLHNEAQGATPVPRWSGSGRPGHTADPKQTALYRWANVTDLDSFIRDVYDYFTGCGIYSILLRRLLTQLQSAFVVAFITFLTWCIDYSKLPESHRLSDVLVPKCTKKIHGFWIFVLWIFILYWLYSSVQLVLEIPKLRAMRDFYQYLLDIPDRDIQTVQWQQVVVRIMGLRDQNLITAANLSPEARKFLEHNSRQRLDAVDIASRLMRQDNYLIALFNKEILDVTIHIPFLGARNFFSETTKAHVQFAVMNFVFSGPRGTFNQDFLKERNRRDLVKKLRERLLRVGVISIVYSPFTVMFVLTSYVFKYFTEYHKDPSQLGSRDFTTFAQWKFREFNELPHLFSLRKNMAYPYANLYLAQFPKDKTEQLMSFVAFVVGAIGTVLVGFTLFDHELFLNFEITSGTTALVWITTCGSIYAAMRSGSPREEQVQDPAYYLEHVTYHTRYEPESWHNRLHSDEVRAEFVQLYKMKILIFAEEVLSMIVTPFLLIFCLPKCSERIVDFFREFSIVVDGLGVVCSYSMFPFNQKRQNAPFNGRSRPDDDPALREDYFKTKDDKMLKSYYGFLDTYQLPGNKGKFHPPPQFPNTFGAMSQTAHPVEPGARGNSRGPAGRQPLHHRTPRHGPTAGRDEPINSILLDPHHQPSASALRGSPRQAPHARYRSSLQPLADHEGPPPSMSRHNSSRIEEESTIGDSWRMSRLAQDEEEEEEAPGNNRGGVLQLLQQFSKAQTDGRTAGVSI